MSTVNDKNNTEQPVVAKKRGRKSKKELEIAAAQKAELEQNNIQVSIEESPTSGSTEENVNIDFLNLGDVNSIKDDDKNIIDDNNDKDIDSDKPVAKKRGRKPKGGKIIQQVVPINNNKETKPNVILEKSKIFKFKSLRPLSSPFFPLWGTRTEGKR
jgi:hypothetical protein